MAGEAGSSQRQTSAEAGDVAPENARFEPVKEHQHPVAEGHLLAPDASVYIYVYICTHTHT